MPKKKKNQKYWKKKADVLCGKIVRARGKCEHCGRTDGKLEWAHIIGRSCSALRHDLRNSLCLDWSCHYRFTNNPIEFAEWVKKYIGEQEYERLREIARTPQKTDYAKTLEKLKEYAEEEELG